MVKGGSALSCDEKRIARRRHGERALSRNDQQGNVRVTTPLKAKRQSAGVLAGFQRDADHRLEPKCQRDRPVQHPP